MGLRKGTGKDEPSTKICKYCQSEIPVKAKVCPVCRKSQSSKLKGLLIVLIVLILIILLFGGGDSDSDEDAEKSTVEQKRQEETVNVKNTESDTQETQTEAVYSFEYDNCTVKYLSHEITENSVGDLVLVVYYEFTNNDKEAQCFDYQISSTAYQDGVEVEHSYFHANEESKNSGKKIQKGVTLTVADVFELGESRTPVTIELRPYSVWSDKLLMSIELSLDGLE